MAKILNLGTLVTLAIAATLLGHTTATTYIVGDALGWTYPPNNTVYATWASKYVFAVGDVLVFNFVTEYHTVATTTKESFDACNVSSTISLIKDGPANITLNSTGEAYFFCTVPTHCSVGQKFAINVTASTSSPPSSPPSLGPTTSPSLTPTTSPSLGPTTSPSLGPTASPSPNTPSPATNPPPPSGATRTGLASIFSIFISAALCLLF